MKDTVSWCFMPGAGNMPPPSIQFSYGLGKCEYGGSYFGIDDGVELSTEYLEGIYELMLKDFPNVSFEDMFRGRIFVEMSSHPGLPPLDEENAYLFNGPTSGDPTGWHSRILQHPLEYYPFEDL